MCGIALLVGPGAEADRATFEAMLAAVTPRGESVEVATAPQACLGTSRLRIVDREHAVQPWRSADGRWTINLNGEIFNHDELRAELGPTRTRGDTEVALEAVLAWGEAGLRRLRGEFALAITDTATQRVFLARDPVGVKPLYWARRDGRLHVASEIKALVGLGVRVHEVPPGHCGWASPGPGPDADPELHPYLDLYALGAGLPELTDVEEAAAAVRATFLDAVACRVDTDLRVGVILSGGLDSSLTLLAVHARHPDCIAFTVGTEGSEDVVYARRLCADLGVEHVVVPVRPASIGLREIREAVRVAELTEYGDIINAVVSRRLFAAVRAAGVKVVLTGDGSDELFGGYDMYRRIGADDVRRLFLHKIRYLSHTELQRVDRTSMSQCVEARVPFLDPAMLELAMRLPRALKVRDGSAGSDVSDVAEKWILRHAFAEVLPPYILARHKNPMSHSSGLHERIRLYRPLFRRFYREAGYECFAPLQRDFSEVLRDHGYDLDAAVAAARPARDLTVAEHARDLAGALRWNVTHALRRPRAAIGG